MLKQLAIGAALALGALRALPAQQTRTITFDEAISIALKQNVAVRQAENAASVGDAAVQQEKNQLLPDLRFSVSGANNVGRNFSQSDGAIVNQQTQSLSTGISTSMTLFDGGRTRSSIRSAQSSRDASDLDLTRARQTAVFTVASDFVTLANRNEQLRVQQENQVAQEAQLQLIQTFVNAGSRPAADQYQQQAAVASAKLAVVQARRDVELSKIDLIQALQLDPAGAYDFAAPVTSGKSADRLYELDSLVTLALANRSDLRGQQARLDAAGQDVKSAKAGHLPSVSLSGGYSSAYSSAADIAFKDQLDQRRGGSIGIGVSVPLFDRGATSVAEQRAQLAVDNARLALDNERQTVALEVRRAYLDQTSAREQLAAAEAQLTAAAQALTMTQERYRAGAATLVEVTQAQSQRVSAESAVITARYNLILQQTVIAYYTGELDPASASLGT